MHNHHDKYPSRPGFKPGTPRLQALVDTNEPSGPAQYVQEKTTLLQEFDCNNVEIHSSVFNNISPFTSVIRA